MSFKLIGLLSYIYMNINKYDYPGACHLNCKDKHSDTSLLLTGLLK